VAPTAPLNCAGLGRRALALSYELLILGAVVFAGAIVLVPITRVLDPLLARPLLQFALLMIVAVYFTWQWTHGGQTLAMKTWRIRLVGPGGAPVDVRRALLRLLLALAGTLLVGAGFAWASVDRERQFLHDRLAGTRLIKDEG
jgi:uncharacterized RDD family membrane protein YckC